MRRFLTAKSLKQMQPKEFLKKLGLKTKNAGAWTGLDSVPGSRRYIDSYSPVDGEFIGSVGITTREQYDTVIASAESAFQTWREMPAPKRGEIVRQFGDVLRQYKDPLGRLVSYEMGKSLQEGFGEVQEMIDICDFAVGLSRQLYGLTMHSERPGHRMYEQWHPLGIVGIISAFNFPVAVWSWNACIAWVCGDVCVWKPSEKTPLCSVACQILFQKVLKANNLPEGISCIINGDYKVGEYMTKDARVPLLSATGSTRMGRIVGQSVAGRFGRSILELGGNNAIIVAADANLDMAVRAILFGAVGTAGQRCTSTRRIIAQRGIAGALVDRLVKAYGQVRIGDPLAEGTLMGPLVNAQAVDQMQSALGQAVAEGGQVVHGGARRPDIGPQFVEPAIVRMPAQTAVVRQETFAPILYILEYDTTEQALHLHNDVPQGLSSAVFTESVRTAEEFLSPRGSDCGIANVNIGTSGAEIGGAFGGEKETGGGRESGSDAWKAYMRRQTNTVNWSTALPLAQGITFGA